MPGSRASKAFTSVDFPAPDGAATMKSFPEAGAPLIRGSAPVYESCT
jgi:hypothetical protein